MIRALFGGVVVGLLLSGCDGCAPGAESPRAPESQAGGERQPAAAQPGAAGSAEPQASPAESGDPDGSVPSFRWTREPSLESVPDVPVRGKVGEQRVDFETVLFQRRAGRWALIVAAPALPRPTALVPGNARFVRITGFGDVLEPGRYEKESVSPGGGHLQRPLPDDPERYRSWRGPNTYRVEITDLQRAPYDESGALVQVAGRASGRLVVVYEGDEEAGYERVWVAGHFEDAPVRYLGPPH